MSDDGGSQKNGDPAKDELLSRWVGKRLGVLRNELAANRQRFQSLELRIDGLSMVLLRGLPFAAEHGEQVADVIMEAASIQHQQGEALFVAADEIRKRSKTTH